MGPDDQSAAQQNSPGVDEDYNEGGDDFGYYGNATKNSREAGKDGAEEGAEGAEEGDENKE